MMLEADPELALDILNNGGKLRQGRSIGRTLYAQRGEEPSNTDLCIGIVDSPQLAAKIVHAMAWLQATSEARRKTEP